MKDATKVVMVLDRSGSMSQVKNSMEEVLNGWVTQQKAVPGGCNVTLAQFDDKYDIVFQNTPIKDVGQIKLQPRGSTALLDAIGRTIDAVGTELAAMSESERPNKVMFVVVTDGFENASQEYVGKNGKAKASRISEMVGHQRDKYGWEFVFLGADQDAIASASGVGFDPGTALNFTNTPIGVKGMGAKLSRMTTEYRTSKGGAGGQSVRAIASENAHTVVADDATQWDKLMAAAQTTADTKDK